MRLATQLKNNKKQSALIDKNLPFQALTMNCRCDLLFRRGGYL